MIDYKALDIPEINNDNIPGPEYGIGGFKPDKAISVLENKYGDCKGMTSLLVVLLNQLEIDAHYCWITTNKHPY